MTSMSKVRSVSQIILRDGSSIVIQLDLCQTGDEEEEDDFTREVAKIESMNFESPRLRIKVVRVEA